MNHTGPRESGILRSPCPSAQQNDLALLSANTIVRTLADAGIVISDKRPLLDESSLTTWDDALSAFRHLQAMEIWEEHGAWIEENQPNFGPGTSDRFAMARDMHAELATSEGVSRKAASQAARDAMTEAVKRLVPAGGAIVIPTAPGPAPLKATPPDALNAFRNAFLGPHAPAMTVA